MNESRAGPARFGVKPGCFEASKLLKPLADRPIILKTRRPKHLFDHFGMCGLADRDFDLIEWHFCRLNLDEKDTPLTNDLASGGHPVMALNLDQRRRDRFERIVLPHLDAAYVLARWLTRDQDDAGDVVQEAFLRALRYFDSYRDGDARSWLLKIVRHTCYSWLARNRPAGVTSLEAEAECGNEVTAISIDADALLENRSDLQRLQASIMTLPAPLREMLVLREFHELGYREIAEVTGVPIGTVMSRLYRARCRLLHTYDVTAPAPDDGVALSVECCEHGAAVLGQEHRG